MCQCHDVYDEQGGGSPGQFVGPVSQCHDLYPDAVQAPAVPSAPVEADQVADTAPVAELATV